MGNLVEVIVNAKVVFAITELVEQREKNITKDNVMRVIHVVKVKAAIMVFVKRILKGLIVLVAILGGHVMWVAQNKKITKDIVNILMQQMELVVMKTMTVQVTIVIMQIQGYVDLLQRDQVKNTIKDIVRILLVRTHVQLTNHIVIRQRTSTLAHNAPKTVIVMKMKHA